MGKFISTIHNDTVDAITNFNKAVIHNDFYAYNAQGKGTKVIYYNINTDLSTLDPGSKLVYTDIGEDSPIRFNRINNLYIYQFNRLELNFNNDEFGLESSEVSGTSYILPNTFQPIDGDFFLITHLDNSLLFKVRDVDRDTLDNGANVWKIDWVLDRVTDKDILKNVVEEYEYLEPEMGTNIKSIVKKTNYDKALKLQEISSTLVEYFKDIFYSDKIQSFTYKWYNEYNMYDPYAIEFIIRNKLLSSGEKYMYVDHQVPVSKTFAIEYDRSIFRVYEERDRSKLEKCLYDAQANYIDDPTTIFATRYEQYFCLDYKVIRELNGPFNPRRIIPIQKQEVINAILYNLKFEEDSDKGYYNIFVKYFNNGEISDIDIDNVKNIDFQQVEAIFYDVLLLIFVFDFYTKKLLS